MVVVLVAGSVPLGLRLLTSLLVLAALYPIFQAVTSLSGSRELLVDYSDEPTGWLRALRTLWRQLPFGEPR
jgi:hypothetical protein